MKKLLISVLMTLTLFVSMNYETKAIAPFESSYHGYWDEGIFIEVITFSFPYLTGRRTLIFKFWDGHLGHFGIHDQFPKLVNVETLNSNFSYAISDGTINFNYLKSLKRISLYSLNGNEIFDIDSKNFKNLSISNFKDNLLFLKLIDVDGNLKIEKIINNK
ncbi:MAG: hypothetical protein H6615_05985 [Ignavibacteria bacterium]|nr:hypothetical protein [Ignavibacteria bacterium]